MVTFLIFTILCTNSIINCFSAMAFSTIKIDEELNATSKLVSPGGNFTLGFFTIAATNYTYLGIWYSIDVQSRKVWVANRDRPITESTYKLLIDPRTGKLVIRTGATTLVNVSDVQIGPSRNIMATLENTGNFQLIRETDNQVLWQSFDFPTNVLLPGMKLGSNLRTQKNWTLTSWLSDEIPDLGAFSFSWEEHPRWLMIRRHGQPYWTSGKSLEYFISDSPFLLSQYSFSYVNNNEEKSFSFQVQNSFLVLPMWILNPQGQIEDYSAVSAISTPEFCYGSDSGNGCMGVPSVSQCKIRTDDFRKMNGEFDGNLTRTSYDDNSSLSISDCMVNCWNDCTCVGFTTNSNGTGCIFYAGANVFSVNPLGNSVLKYVLVSQNSSPRKGNAKKWVVIVIPVTVFVLSLLVGICYFLRRRIRQEAKNRELLELMTLEGFTEAMVLMIDGKNGQHFKVFSYSCIEAATDKFSSENKLGEGGFGPVYKGKLHEGQEIAVKKLSKRSGQGLVEFKTELILIAKLQHTNLVRLFGCCIREDEKMLIYEYMPNKSLDFFIFDEVNKQYLPWERRFNIIEGVAQGLLYLHKYSRLRIVHRDLKASNILLDENMTPKISDFGLARICKPNLSERHTVKIAGTRGYMAPEYLKRGTFSVKTDVFSFGVLILEIVSGRKANNSYDPERPINLVAYAWELWNSDSAIELMDSAIVGSCNSPHQLLRCIHIGLLCVQHSASHRPTMLDVISMLSSDNSSLAVPRSPAFLSMENSIEDQQAKTSVNALSCSEIVGR